MNNQDLATTLTKLGGVALIVYSLINAASYLPYLLGGTEEVPASTVISVYFAKVALPALIGLLFIYFGGLLVGRKMPATKVAPEKLESLEKTALSVMGVYLFYYAATDMVVHLSYLYQVNRMIKSGVQTSFEEEMDADLFAAMVATGFEIVFALWLILGSAGLVNMFNRFRDR